MRRRSILQIAGLSLLPVIAGCVGDGDGSGDDEQADIQTWCEDLEEGSYGCPAGDPVSTTTDYTDHSQYELEDGNVTAGGVDMPFEDWAEGRCPFDATEVVPEALDDALDEVRDYSEVLASISYAPIAVEDEDVVNIRVPVDEEEDDEPAYVEEIRDAAPVYVDVTITFEDRSYECIVPAIYETGKFPEDEVDSTTDGDA